MSIVKYLIVVAVKKNWSLFQTDVNNAFLHGDLDEEVYMKLPPGLSVASPSSVSLACIEVTVFPDGVLLNQKKFVSDMLKEFDFLGVTSVASPLELTPKLKDVEDEVLSSPEKYRRLIGKLLFLTHTRPNICFDVQHLSQFLHTLRIPHMVVAHHLLCYLKGTHDFGLFYSNNLDFSVKAYTDSD
uniref:Uncharacterized protein LOC104237576 n=1 Tax=Nicotiana sylvestris TaxID=4096 RepID=A0A1U7XKB4_NICSY|nr:PREDICTED: uncharacterized protein LOC104237576 [Nicotiana sylvestris]